MGMKLYFDGGCSPNPGMMEAAIISDCGAIKLHLDKLGHGTNNEAEWIGMVMAVTTAVDQNGPVTILGDSKLVISQAEGKWKCNHDHLRKYLDEYKKIVATAKHPITLQHVKRDLNLAGIYIEQIQNDR